MSDASRFISHHEEEWGGVILLNINVTQGILIQCHAASSKVTVIPGPSAKDMLSKKINEIYNNVTKVSSSSRSRISYRAAWSPTTLENRMYLLHIHHRLIISLFTVLLITSVISQILDLSYSRIMD
jgi:hypothetical protein